MDYQRNYQFGTQISKVFIKEIEPLLQAKKVLDLGCGQGDYLQFFGPGSVGMDLAPANLKIAKQRGLKVQSMDFNKPILPKEKFDAVFASHVLEHVERPIDFLRYTHQALRPGGTLVIAVPNERSPMHLKYPYFTANGNHLYSFSVNNLRELMLYCGFSLSAIHYDFYTAITDKLKLNPLLRFLDLTPEAVRQQIAWAFWVVARKN